MWHDKNRVKISKFDRILRNNQHNVVSFQSDFNEGRQRGALFSANRDQRFKGATTARWLDLKKKERKIFVSREQTLKREGGGATGSGGCVWGLEFEWRRAPGRKWIVLERGFKKKGKWDTGCSDLTAEK